MENIYECHDDRKPTKRGKFQEANEVQTTTTMLDLPPQVPLEQLSVSSCSLPTFPKPPQTEQEIDTNDFPENQASGDECNDKKERTRSNELKLNCNEGRPRFDPDQSAVTFFSNPFFYDDDEAFANDESYVAKRKNKFGAKTVKTALKEIPSPLHIYKYFSCIIFSGHDEIQSYWKRINSFSTEERLNGQILCLWKSAEIELIENRYVNLDFRNSTSLLHEGKDGRQNDICVVLGPSGSGKTFFSVKKAAKFNPSANDDGKVVYSMTVYLYAGDFMDAILRNKLSQEIIQEIRKRTCFDGSEWKELAMHVSVVIDEAGSEESRHFENISKLDKIYHDLKSLAKKVRLIVTGTGLTAENLNSNSQVLKYRMQAWSRVNVRKVAEERFPLLPLYFLDFVHTRPNLDGLITNARAAWFLLQALVEYMQTYSYPQANEIGNEVLETEVLSELFSYTVSIESTVIPQVARKYIEGNRLKNLTPAQRQCVAAIVFAEVDKSVQEKVPTLPSFFSDNKQYLRETIVAKSLVSVNVEYVNGVLQYAEEKKQSLLISPAITIVLFHLLGVKVGVLSSWKYLEVMTALHSLRKMAIHNLSANNNSSGMLQLIQLRKLSARIPELRAESNVNIPILGASTVWINGDVVGDMAPFADVVAPNFLFQCKHTEQSTSQITCNIYDEFSKCGLLVNDLSRRGKIGWTTLNAIMKDWEGRLISDLDFGNVGRNTIPHGKDRPCKSMIFYPEAQIKVVEVYKDAGIEFVSIPVDQTDASYLTAEVKVELNFVLSTNADILKLTFEAPSVEQKWTEFVTADDVDEDGKLRNKKNWDFIFQRIRENVTLRFYFG